jgi:hypothetical protein
MNPDLGFDLAIIKSKFKEEMVCSGKASLFYRSRDWPVITLNSGIAKGGFTVTGSLTKITLL